ncbi:helix-turn-helix domain-containing protein, partial [Serratia marcescens]|uniref:helix-turn-helix domain-containing protein n=1 Tax=Serratia marcescens TaxID=615 RepID=UPI0019532548
MEITDDNEGASASSGAQTPHVLANLGEEIRRLRRSRGLRVTELAARIDRSVGFVSQIERGLSKPA